MQIGPERGWIKAGLAVLVAGSLGAGVMAATDFGWGGPKKVTAGGVEGDAAPPPGPPAGEGFDLAAAAPLAGQDEAPAGPEVGEKIKVGGDGGSVTVSKVEDGVQAGRLFGAGEGMKYVAVEVRGCAGPNEKNLTFQPSYFLLRLDDGTVHDPGPGVKKPSLDGGRMEPGKCLGGWVTYTVQEGALATTVIYDGSSRLTWTVPVPKGAKPTTTTTTTAPADDDDSEERGTTSTTRSAGKASTTTTTAKKSKASAASTTSTTGKKASAKASTTTTTTTKKKSTTSSTSEGKSGTTSTTDSGSAEEE